MQIRKLTGADQPAARALGEEAFGSYGGAPVPTEVPPGRHPWGAFDGDRLVAKVQAHEYVSWWQGQQVATCGIAGVAVAAEHRGGGLLRELFAHALAEAVERGEVLSILYPTANGIYRSLGYELIGSLDTVEVPTAELGRIIAPADGTTTRRANAADAADAADIAATYDVWAREQNGPLTRTGPLFARTDDQPPTEPDHTLALSPGGEVVGVLTWSRDGGYGAQGRLVVRDLIGLTADAYRALWRIAGSFASVTGTVRLTTSGADPARHLLPSMTWDVVDRHPVMLRVLAPAPALGLLAASTPLADGAGITVAVRGDRLGVLDGTYAIDGGTARASSGGPDDVATYTPQGLALAFAGVQSSGNLRMLDHLTGPREHDRALDALGSGRPVHLRDYF